MVDLATKSLEQSGRLENFLISQLAILDRDRPPPRIRIRRTLAFPQGNWVYRYLITSLAPHWDTLSNHFTTSMAAHIVPGVSWGEYKFNFLRHCMMSPPWEMIWRSNLLLYLDFTFWMTFRSIGCSRGVPFGGKNMVWILQSFDLRSWSFGWPGALSSMSKVFLDKLDLFINWFTSGSNYSCNHRLNTSLLTQRFQWFLQ